MSKRSEKKVKALELEVDGLKKKEKKYKEKVKAKNNKIHELEVLNMKLQNSILDRFQEYSGE